MKNPMVGNLASRPLSGNSQWTRTCLKGCGELAAKAKAAEPAQQAKAAEPSTKSKFKAAESAAMAKSAEPAAEAGVDAK